MAKPLSDFFCRRCGKAEGEGAVSIALLKIIGRIEQSARELDLPVTTWGKLCRLLLPEVYGGTSISSAAFIPSKAKPGSAEDIEIKQHRLALRLPTRHPMDRYDEVERRNTVEPEEGEGYD